MKKHTPMPWHAYPTDNGYWYIGHVNEPPQTTEQIEPSVENQDLIESAPDLLEILEKILANIEVIPSDRIVNSLDYRIDGEIIDLACGVVAKARGD